MQELERAHADGLNIALWASLPCTAGTPWFRLSQKFASARAKNAVHLATFHKLMDNCMILAERVMNLNRDLHWERPTHCELWKDPEIQNMIQYFSMHAVNLHGCALCRPHFVCRWGTHQEAVDHRHDFVQHALGLQERALPWNRGTPRPRTMRRG